MTLQIIKNSYDTINRSTIITGSARSGTTIVNSLVHSLDGISSEFEPPLLMSLIPMIHKMESESWMLLFETYLLEDVFFPSIGGRRINLNQHDDSSIWKVKPTDEIKERLSRSWSKNELIAKATEYQLAFKIPNVVPYLKSIQTLYPQMKIIATRRNYKTTLASLLKKGWFNTEALNQGSIWPFTLSEGQCIPFWVDEEDQGSWARMQEMERCAYYFIKMNESLIDLPNRYDVWYEDLIKNPTQIIRDISNHLNAKVTVKTQDIIDTVCLRDNRSNLDYSSLPKNIVEKMKYLSERTDTK